MKILSKTFNLSAKHRVLLRAQSNYTGGRQRPPPKRIGSVPFSAGTLRVPAANDVASRRHLLRRTTALRAVEGQATSVKSVSTFSSVRVRQSVSVSPCPSVLVHQSVSVKPEAVYLFFRQSVRFPMSDSLYISCSPGFLSSNQCQSVRVNLTFCFIWCPSVP